jgi:predicted Zn finger-like uncharacterized protein
VLVVCPECAARYRVGGDRVPPQGARARCPKCDRVFRVGLPRVAGTPPVDGARTSDSSPAGGAGAGQPATPAAADFAGRDSTDGGERSNAALAKRIQLARRESGNLPLLVSHGYGLGVGGEDEKNVEPLPTSPADELLDLSDADLGKIAEDIVSALAATHPAAVARARADQKWDAHLGELIREAWADFQACVGNGQASAHHFRAALNGIVAGGRKVF